MRLITLIVIGLCLTACNVAPPRHDPYKGLLPTGQQVKSSTEKIDLKAMKQKSAAIVTTANFNRYLTDWQNYYEKGGEQKQKAINNVAMGILSVINPASALGVAASTSTLTGKDNSRQTSDPRNITDRVVSLLQQYFNEVKPASDFAEAQEMKSDYVVLVDFYETWNPMGDRYLTAGGINLLDHRFRKMLDSQGSADIERDEGGFLSGAQGVIDGTARTLARGLDVTTSQMIDGFREKLQAGSK